MTIHLVNLVKNVDLHAPLPSHSAMEYYLHRDGQQWGPYDEATLRSMLAAQQVLPTDLIWNDQMPDWATVESVFPTSTPAPAPAPIPAPTPMPTPAAVATPVAAAGKSTVKPTDKPVVEAKPDKTETGKKSSLPKIAGIAVAGLAVVGVVLWFFVFRSTPSAPRSKDEIMREIATLPVLFLTEKTKRKVTGPADPINFVDKETGEICWRARACHNPDCPEKSSDGTPHLFISPNPAVFLEADGTFGFDMQKAGNDPTMGACPECLKNRNLGRESKFTKKKYADWVKPYTSPKSENRQKELLKEHAAAAN